MEERENILALIDEADEQPEIAKNLEKRWRGEVAWRKDSVSNSSRIFERLGSADYGFLALCGW